MLALGVARFDSVAFNSCMMSMGGLVAIAAQSPHFVIKQTYIFLLLVWVLEGISSTGQHPHAQKSLPLSLRRTGTCWEAK